MPSAKTLNSAAQSDGALSTSGGAVYISGWNLRCGLFKDFSFLLDTVLEDKPHPFLMKAAQ